MTPEDSLEGTGITSPGEDSGEEEGSWYDDSFQKPYSLSYGKGCRLLLRAFQG